MWKKIQKLWWFYIKNPVIRKGESGGFKWKFRRLWFEIRTLSGNFRMRFTAAEHPFGYLLSSEDDLQVEGFGQIMYSIGMLLTTDQKLVNDISKALKDYNKRLEDSAKVVEDEVEENVAVEEMKQVQELVEKPKKERKKVAKDIDKRFKKAVKEVQK